METKSLWDGVGFRDGPLMAAQKGLVETNTAKQACGFRDVSQNDVYKG